MTDQPKKYDPNVRTGSLEPIKGPDGRVLHWPSGAVRYRSRVRWPDGSRPRKNVPEAYCYSKERAEEYVRAIQEGIDAGTAAPKPTAAPAAGESARQWVDRYVASLTARDVVTASDIRGRLVNWGFKVFGHKRMKDVSRDDVEALVRDLDAKILERARAGRLAGISWKTAKNIWSDTCRAFDEACSSKDPSLRVLERSPCERVRGPDGGVARAKPFLRPAEVVTLLADEDVPARRQALYAVAIYTAMRQGELRALTAADLDFDALQIRVSKQARTNTEEARGRTKTGRARFVHIEANLLPLLRWLSKHPMGPAGRLLHVPPPEDCAELLRNDLAKAGCDREEITADDAQREPLTFHKLRHTCGIHMAVRRDPPFDVQWRMGHTNAAMTEGYIAEARQAAGARFGDPLPALPKTLLKRLSRVTEPGHSLTKYPKLLRPQRELNPCYRRERPVS
jgi:integrase